MGAVGCSFLRLEFNPEEPPSVLGELPSSGLVNIELWVDGVDVTSEVTATLCNEINETGRYSWSTGNIPVLDASQKQYHFRMTDSISSQTDEGDFILFQREAKDGLMPSLNDPDSYIVKHVP